MKSVSHREVTGQGGRRPDCSHKIKCPQDPSRADGRWNLVGVSRRRCWVLGKTDNAHLNGQHSGIEDIQMCKKTKKKPKQDSCAGLSGKAATPGYCNLNLTRPCAPTSLSFCCRMRVTFDVFQSFSSAQISLWERQPMKCIS